MKLNLLILDDDPVFLKVMELALKGNYELHPAHNYVEAISILEREDLDGAIIDIDLKDPQHDGTQVLVEFKKRFPEKPAIMESGFRDVPTVVKCMKLGANDYLEKPFDEATLNLKLNKVFSDSKKFRVLKRAFDKSVETNQLVGESEGIRRAIQLVQQAQDMRILFYGETGVGKTPFALLSNKVVAEREGQARPFEQVNCACLNNEQFQDQIFGHKKGAFTGAIADKRGLVELAQGGDLFLDEIGEMPLETQANFLTFLDSMEYYRLGDDKKRRADVRVLCATNRDLKKMVEEGKFRQDLYSRISQVVVNIPPLRERKSDIKVLFEHFVNAFAGYDKPYDEEIVELFKKFHWEEGNVRELRDAVEYLVIMSRAAERIEVSHLSDRYRPFEDPKPLSESQGVGAEVDTEVLYEYGLETYLSHLEKKILEDQLKSHTGSVEAMAKKLRISRPTLYRRLKKYDIGNVRIEGYN
ncbi:MAG: sigma-54 dependent transcriptional regulator [Bdellovibrionota bacterium]